MKKKERFSGQSVRDFLNIHRGMPVQATIVKEYARLKKYDYDAFRYACDDYMRGVWRSSYYKCHHARITRNLDALGTFKVLWVI